MLKRSGPYNKQQLIDAAIGYADLYDGRVPYLEVETKKIGYVVFERKGGAWVVKEVLIAPSN